MPTKWTWHELLQTLSIQESSPSSYSVLVECSSRSPRNCASVQKLQLQKLHEVAAFYWFWTPQFFRETKTLFSWIWRCVLGQHRFQIVCFIACGVGFFVPNVLPPHLTLRNLCTSWRMTLWNPCATDGHHEEAPCAMLVQSMDIVKKNHLVQICGHREEAPCAIYGYHEEESPCAILVQICGHREESPCEIVVQSMDIVKKNHLVQSVNIMKNPSPVCQSLYLWCRDWCLLQRRVAWIMVMMWFLVSSRVNSQIVPTYSWIVWWEKLSSTLELSLWTFQRNKNCAEMMTLGGGGCKQ